MTRPRTLSLATTLLVLGVYAVACVVPAGYYRGKFLEEGVTPYGLNLAVLGWVTILLDGALGLAWFANPLLLVGVVCLWRGRYGPAAFWSGVAVGLSFLPLIRLAAEANPTIRINPDPALVVDVVYAQAELRIGYFVWVEAHGLLFGVALFEWYRGRGRPPEPTAVADRPGTDQGDAEAGGWAA